MKPWRRTRPEYSQVWTPRLDGPELRRMWREVCTAVPRANQIIPTVTGPTVKTPRMGALSAGPPVLFTVELLPGQLLEDVRAAAARLAPHLGAHSLRLTPIGLAHVRVALLTSDPLAQVVPPATPVASALHPITLGITEDATAMTLDLSTAAHVIAQGATGSGKSVGLYSLLGQLTAAPDVRVTGCDPTGLLLAPWAGRWADVASPALGTVDPLAYVDTLAHTVKEMDQRIAVLPAGRDQVFLGVDCPVILVVLEEYPAQLRILDAHDPRAGKTYRGLVARVLAEGRKAGIRAVLITQRADAAIIGAYERGQASHRISYRVDSVDGIRMLHPDITPDVAAQHVATVPGVALLTAPGQPLTRVRSPYLPYAEYCAAVSQP